MSVGQRSQLGEIFYSDGAMYVESGGDKPFGPFGSRSVAKAVRDLALASWVRDAEVMRIPGSPVIHVIVEPDWTGFYMVVEGTDPATNQERMAGRIRVDFSIDDDGYVFSYRDAGRLGPYATKEEVYAVVRTMQRLNP